MSPRDGRRRVLSREERTLWAAVTKATGQPPEPPRSDIESPDEHEDWWRARGPTETEVRVRDLQLTEREQDLHSWVQHAAIAHDAPPTGQAPEDGIGK